MSLDRQPCHLSALPPPSTLKNKHHATPYSHTNIKSFLHGGAWRDPRATFDEAQPTITALLGGDPRHALLPRASSRLAGVASLNYRLSPHPSFAQDPRTTPALARRAARHPDHLADVLAGLRFLQRTFGFGADYVLSGHSAGAFLSYQVLLGPACLPPAGGPNKEGGGDGGYEYDDVELPAAAVGFEGIYDLAGLDARRGGSYASFMAPAFGLPGDGWDAASPATAGGGGPGFGPGGNWRRGPRLAVLAHSPDDELVDVAECDAMEARLRRDGVANVRVFRDLRGGHFEVVKDGSFARVLRETWDELERLDRV